MALAWLAAVLIDWYYPLYMALLAAFFLAWGLVEVLRRRRMWAEWSRAVLAVAASFLFAGILLAPLLIPMLREAGRSPYLEEAPSFSRTMGADVAAFVLPGPLHPLWGRYFSRWTDRFASGNTAEGIVYLGVVALLLAAIGLWRYWLQGKMWVALAAVFAILAMGPYLKVLNYDTGFPLPYLLLHYLPIARFTRVPSRYVVLVQLGVAVLVGLGGAALLRERTREWPPSPGKGRSGPARVALLAALLLALVGLDYLPAPCRVTPAVVNRFYQQLANDRRSYALLEVPLQRPNSPWYYTHWMLDQTVHAKDSFRGYISRGDPLFPFSGAPFLRQLAGLGDSDITYDDWHPLSLAVLNHYRVGYIVLERQRLQEQGRLADIQHLVEQALGPLTPAYDNADLLAYEVPQAAPAPFLALGAGWHEVEEQDWGSFRWMERDQSEVYVVLPAAGQATIQFRAASFLRPRRLEILRDGTAVASLEVGTAPQLYQVQMPLPAGETRLQLRAEGYDVPRDVGAGDDPRSVSIAFSDLRIR
jgi:hypothetical protein